MILAGLQGEGGGQGDHGRAALGERREELGEAQIIADGAADGDALAIIGDDGSPGFMVADSGIACHPVP